MTPWSAGLLWPILLVAGFMALAWWVRAARTRKVAEYLSSFPAPEFLPAPEVSLRLPGWWKIRTVLMAGAGAFLTLAWAGVDLGTRQTPIREGASPVVVILDVSRSMEVQDVPFGRLNSARLLVRRVVARLPSNPVGLWVSAGGTHQLLPISFDRDLLFRYLDAAEPGLMSDQGTSLSRAMAEGLATMDGVNGSPYPVFLLISDGEHHGDPAEPAALAREIRERGGRVSAVSVGSPGGGPVPASTGFDLALMSAPSGADTGSGAPYSRARPELLAALAEAGGGLYARAEDPEGVASFLAGVGEWGGPINGVSLVPVPVEGWPWFLGLALGALFIESFLGQAGGRREVRWW